MYARYIPRYISGRNVCPNALPDPFPGQMFRRPRSAGEPGPEADHGVRPQAGHAAGSDARERVEGAHRRARARGRIRVPRRGVMVDRASGAAERGLPRGVPGGPASSPSRAPRTCEARSPGGSRHRSRHSLQGCDAAPRTTVMSAPASRYAHRSASYAQIITLIIAGTYGDMRTRSCIMRAGEACCGASADARHGRRFTPASARTHHRGGPTR